MKKLLLFIFISASFHLFAQTNVYHPFPDSNAAWNQGCTWLVGIPPVPVTYPQVWSLTGDTIISAVIYKKLHSSGYAYYLSSCCWYYNNYEGAIRQDTTQRKVYYVPKTASNEQLLYDFNLNIGDTLPPAYNNSPNTNYVSSIDSLLVGTSYRKQFHISLIGATSSWDSNYVFLIEGIGSTFGLTADLYPPFEGGCGLGCFIENDSIVYTNPLANCDMTIGLSEYSNQNILISIYPNPTKGIFTITSSEMFKCSVYDVFGREVFPFANQSIRHSTKLDLSSHSKGIYVVRIKSEGKITSRKVVLQ